MQMVGERDEAGQLDVEMISLCFGKAAAEIEGQTLGVCLTEFVTVLDQIALQQHLHFDLRMRVRPFKAGSFIVPIELYPSFIADTLAHVYEHMPLIRKSLEVYIEFLKLKKLLRGKQPLDVSREDKRALVMAEDHATINISVETLNLYQNNVAANAGVERQFQRLEEDESIDRYVIVDAKKRELFLSDRDDFASIGSKVAKERRDAYSETKRVSLYINKPVLDKKASSWRFIHEGNAISARMRDPKFLDRIAEGERFAMGDRLEVDMEIKQEFDESLQTYRIKSREITHVHEHIPRMVQGQLRFPEDT